ncbi:MAG TPA: RdgB/HAM1 family non-canonical purine NTP pyrophosphatase [Polyangiaceae bacterium]|nr:RdgB/HAM1 family non-canonical purine NTP pyrophosphatase [Polyangiaceae bacterium]
MKLVFATTNPHKIREVREILGPLGVEVESLAEAGVEVPPPVEDGATFEENARAKATGYALALGRACLADDSGVEVDALGGAPGVHSAVYAGVSGPREERDRANREKLVEELRKSEDANRSARLVCTLCLADGSGRILFEARGAVECRVLEEGRGDAGFGYDPLLFLPDVQKTLAELPADEWNARSHRGAAVRELHAWLSKNTDRGEPT